MRDYLRSFGTRDEVERELREGFPAEPSSLWALPTRHRTIATVYDRVVGVFGSVSAYLTACGVTKAQLRMPSWHQDAVAGDSEHKGTEERDLEFASVSAADLDLATDEEKEQAEKAGAGNEELLSELRDALGDKVVDVKVAAGLGSAPARVAAEGPVSLEMDRIISQGPEAKDAPQAQRVLELNAAHPVYGKLVAAKEAGDADRLKLYGRILYDQALLVEGLPIDDPVEFAKEVTELMRFIATCEPTLPAPMMTTLRDLKGIERSFPCSPTGRGQYPCVTWRDARGPALGGPGWGRGWQVRGRGAGGAGLTG